MNHTYELLLALGVLSPMVSFWLLVFFGPKLGKPAAGWVGVALGMFVPLLLASYVLYGWWMVETDASRAALTANAFRFDWATLGGVPLSVGVKLDSLTVAMYFMVTFIATWIFVFSVGYMAGHSDEVAHRSMYHRFFAYLSLFGFSMLGLVVSSSLLFLFIFWELVGLCSYLLIGFYFDRGYASRAAMKAFITNRVGDFGFLIGLMLVFFYLKTLDLDVAARVFAQQYAAQSGIFAVDFTFIGWSLATILGIGLFCGAMGKSAQFPLHVWLPDAMAGPTPVSALIHAATMVAAGVYLVARVFRLMTPEALLFVATIGCLTLFLMALVAIVQTDIKKCLAYSTLSQLGYMIFGLGCGAWIAALFHLITHAFFKAMLFLGSGQVIEGCHHEQDMRKMGGLLKKMPVTGFTFLIGVLAIAGFGIPGLHIGALKFGLGGFFSKDEILAVAWTRVFDWTEYRRHELHEASGGHTEAEGTRVVLASYQEPPQQPLEELDPATRAEVEKVLEQTRLDVQLQFLDQPRVPAPERHFPAERIGTDGIKLTADKGVAAHANSGQFLLPHRTGIFKSVPPMPKWMFYLALATAYITPFYMMRAWWMTFMGKPRDHHVYDHAHESPLMYIPLVVLAAGTVFSSYFLFRPLIADASTSATAAPMVLAIDGEAHTPAIMAAHSWLVLGVGFAFVVGFAVAIALYLRGLQAAESIRRLPFVAPIHTLLVHKYYIDELYDFVWVKGCLAVATVARLVDTYIVDVVFDTLAKATERLASFSGLILDNQGVDGMVNGVAKSSMDLAGLLRSPQTGRIRNYVLFAAGATAIVLIGVLIYAMSGSSAAGGVVGM